MLLKTMDDGLNSTGLSMRKLAMLAGGLLLMAAQTAWSAAAEGAAAPDCKLSSLLDGAAAGVSQHKGKVVLVDFWASWCGPCGQSFPFFNDLHAKHKDQGLEILGVNVDENVDDAKAFLANHAAAFSVVRDASMQCASNYGVQAMPSTYLIDRKGVVHHIHLGFRADESQELRDLVEKALRENWTPTSP